MIICFDVWRTFLWIITILFLFFFSAILYYTFEEWFIQLNLKKDERKLKKLNKKKNGVK